LALSPSEPTTIISEDSHGRKISSLHPPSSFLSTIMTKSPRGGSAIPKPAARIEKTNGKDQAGREEVGRL